MYTWRKLIENEMADHKESFADVVFSISKEENWLDTDFDISYGSVEGPTFTLWTHNRVYFPAQYDGSEWCSSVPRNPCEEIIRHVGGG